jgi:hypothetical protein
VGRACDWGRDRFVDMAAMKILRLIGKHIFDWTEGYLWVPMAVTAIWASGHLVQLMTGHDPKMNIDWLVDYQAVAYKCVYIILFTSIMKQSTGSWMTLEQKMANLYLATLADLKILATFFAFVYVFMH